MVCSYLGITFLIFFYKDRESGLHILPKVLLAYGLPEVAKTVPFYLLMACYSDIIKIRNTQSHEFKRKPMLAPFTYVNDRRSLRLCSVFLNFFQNWLNSVEERQGNFTKDARQKMFISSQTYEGLKITVDSITETNQFFL